MLTPLSDSFESLDIDALLAKTSEAMSKADPKKQLLFISKLLESHTASFHSVLVPTDFLDLSLKAMMKLNQAGRSNVVYNMVKAIGTNRSNSDDSLLPLTRMPMGLIEHCVNFFSSSQLQQVIIYQVSFLFITLYWQLHCPDDYREWLVSMFSLFGTKWVKLFCGPMWKVEGIAQADVAPTCTSHSWDPMQVWCLKLAFL